MEKDEVTYHLPPGFTLAVQPQPASIAWNDNAILRANGTAEGNDVTVGRTLAFNFTVLAPEAYGNLHEFFQRVAAADQQQLVFAISKGESGQ